VDNQFETIKQEVLAANLALIRPRLVVFTWNNAPALAVDDKFCVIRPSGVQYGTMTVQQMVVTDMDGRVAEGEPCLSSGLLMHLELYKVFPQIKSVVPTVMT
jgi:L-ribulose-5-phosphate 4-epimerase